MIKILPFLRFPRIAWFFFAGIIAFCSPGGGLLSAKQPELSGDGTFALLDPSAERVSRGLLRHLGEQERCFWALTGYPAGGWPPIVVVLHRGSDDVSTLPSLSVNTTDDGQPKIQVDLAEEQVRGRASGHLLVTAMLLRAFYAGHSPEQGSPVVAFPAWFTHALGRLCNSSSQALPNSTGYLQGDRPPTVDSFLAQSPPKEENESLMDLYDGTASALLKAGLEHGGPSSIRHWIGRYEPGASSQTPDNWPSEWNKKSVERTWLLLMANDSGAGSSNVTLYGIPETLAKYDEIVSLIPTPGHSLALLKKHKEYVYTARQVSGRLSALRIRANPLAAPLLDETIGLCESLKKLGGRKLNDREGRLRSLREDLLKRSKSIGDYLDWYEAAKVSERSKLFDSILALPGTSVKHGPVGSYLDAVEARGW